MSTKIHTDGSRLSKELLDEFRQILKKNYGLEPTEATAEVWAQNILQFYREMERLSNHLP